MEFREARSFRHLYEAMALAHDMCPHDLSHRTNQRMHGNMFFARHSHKLPPHQNEKRRITFYGNSPFNLLLGREGGGDLYTVLSPYTRLAVDSCSFRQIIFKLVAIPYSAVFSACPRPAPHVSVARVGTILFHVAGS